MHDACEHEYGNQDRYRNMPCDNFLPQHIRQTDQQLSVWLEGECIAQSQRYLTDEACQQALTELRKALAGDEN